MNTEKKKNNLYYVIPLVCGLVSTFFIYSCSTDGYFFDEVQIEKGKMIESHIVSKKMARQDDTLLDSIALSDEFWEFEMNSQLLVEKFQNYTSTLNEKEYNRLMENLNNDDYVECFIKEANLDNELRNLIIAKENLILHTGFLRLNENEKKLLFIQYEEFRKQTGVKLLKLREEGGGTNSCEQQKEARIRQAKADYNSAIVKCRVDSLTSPCIIQATAKYKLDKRVAEREYEECIAK